MRNTVELQDEDVELVVAALLSMSCLLCPLHPTNDCGGDPRCRRLAERVVGGELSEVYGLGGE
ncbi:MAG: hypothetical protein ACM3US_02100 [Sphingomonadaceae bacterium]